MAQKKDKSLRQKVDKLETGFIRKLEAVFFGLFGALSYHDTDIGKLGLTTN